MMDFSVALMELKTGSKITRPRFKEEFHGKSYITIGHSDIKTDVDTHMAKTGDTYSYLCLIVEYKHGNVAYRYHPTVDDLFATDWEITD